MPHHIEAAVCGGLSVEVNDIETSGAQRRDAPAREHSRMKLVPESREIDVADPECAVLPESLAHRPPHHAIEQRQVFRQHNVRAVDLRLARQILDEKTMKGRETEDAAVDEQNARHQSETASSPGTIGRVRGSSPRRAMLPT